MPVIRIGTIAGAVQPSPAAARPPLPPPMPPPVRPLLPQPPQPVVEVVDVVDVTGRPLGAPRVRTGGLALLVGLGLVALGYAMSSQRSRLC